MKRKTARLLTLLLIFSMLLPQMTFAAGPYNLTVTISDVNSPDGPKENVTLTDGLSYLSGSDQLIVVLAQIVSVNLDALRAFKSPAMRDRTYEGLDYAQNNGVGWDIYAQYMFDTNNAQFKEQLKDFNTTLDQIGVGYFEVTHLDDVPTDPKYNVTYTVTFSITYTYSDDDDNGYKVNIDEATKQEKKGKVVVDKPVAPAGRKVTINTYPEEKEILNYIKVLDKDGNRVKLTYTGDGQFTFVMPKGGVTVSGTFRPEPEKPEVTGVSDLLNTTNHEPFMIGDDKGYFEPKDNIQRAEVAQMFYRLLKNKAVDVTASFDDVPADSWYAQAVNVLASIGILEGVNDTDFQPKRVITRAEFAAICARFAKMIEKGNSFADVSSGYWAYDEISTAAAYGWIEGYDDGTFAPRQPITREEAAAIVNRMLYRLGDQIAIDEGQYADFPDVNDRMWSWYEISEATYGHDHTQEDQFVHEFWVEEEKKP